MKNHPVEHKFTITIQNHMKKQTIIKLVDATKGELEIREQSKGYYKIQILTIRKLKRKQKAL